MNGIARIGALLAAITLGFSGWAMAQASSEHSHTTPHGGEVVEVAEHHVEFRADSTGAIAVWVLDAQQKPVEPPGGGELTLMPDQGEPVTLPLTVDAEGQRLTATFDPKTLKAFQAVVSLPIEGKRHNFRFHYPPSHH